MRDPSHGEMHASLLHRGVRRRALVALLALSACGGDASAEPEPSDDGRMPLETFDLPAPRDEGPLSVEAALSRRASVRSFAERSLTTDELGQLLWAADGVNRPDGGRTAPSAGAIYPLELYAVTHERLLHYLPDGHRAEVLAQEDLLEPMREVAQDFVADGAVLFVITGVVARTAERYGERAERFVHLEAGHVAQNILLQAVALELGAVVVGSFDDDAVTTTLGLPEDHAPLYFVVVGAPR